MRKKSFILLTILLFISISTISFADMTNDIKNTVNGATNTVVDGTRNLVEDVRSGIGTVENKVENGLKDVGNATMNVTNDVVDNSNDNYAATRTATEDVSIINNTAASTWTWIAVAIAGIVIVGLVWYYATERNYKH